MVLRNIVGSIQTSAGGRWWGAVCSGTCVGGGVEGKAKERFTYSLYRIGTHRCLLGGGRENSEWWIT